MTKTRSNRGRHRRGRDRAPEVTPVEDVRVGEPGPGPERPPDGDQASNRSREDAQRGQQHAQDRPQTQPRRGQPPGADQQPAGQRSGTGRVNRRRPPRRQQLAPMPNQVLRAKAPITGRLGPVEKRRLEDTSGPDGPILGCPMLTRTRIGLPVTGGQAAPRCALAWAIHSETEATYCMETHDLTRCWKAHPENLDEIKSRLGERSAAD